MGRLIVSEKILYTEISKKISELETYEVNYAIKRAEGEIVFIRHWNGIECVSLNQEPSFTVELECGDSLIESYSYSVSYLVKTESNSTLNLIQKNLKKVDFDNGKFFVAIERDGCIGEASHSKLGNAYALAILKSYYNNNPDAEVLVGEKLRASAPPHNLCFPNSKREGIKMSEFYA